MEYVTIKRFKGKGIGGEFNIPYGKTLELRPDGMLYYDDLPVCVARSFASHQHFACNYDGKGLRRGSLSHSIVEFLSPKNFDSPQDRDKAWEAVWEDDWVQKYRREEHADFWLWNNDFYHAPIEDLERIAELIGMKGV